MNYHTPPPPDQNSLMQQYQLLHPVAAITSISFERWPLIRNLFHKQNATTLQADHHVTLNHSYFMRSYLDNVLNLNIVII